MKNLLSNFQNGKVQLILGWIVLRVLVVAVPEMEMYLEPLREIGIAILGGLGVDSVQKGLSKLETESKPVSRAKPKPAAKKSQ